MGVTQTVSCPACSKECRYELSGSPQWLLTLACERCAKVFCIRSPQLEVEIAQALGKGVMEEQCLEAVDIQVSERDKFERAVRTLVESVLESDVDFKIEFEYAEEEPFYAWIICEGRFNSGFKCVIPVTWEDDEVILDFDECGKRTKADGASLFRYLYQDAILHICNLSEMTS